MSSSQLSRGPHGPTLAYYEANAQRFFKGTHNVDMSELYKPFLALLPPGAHVLDAGCGSGRDSLAFLKRGYEVTAMDASMAMAELSSRLIGRPVLRLSFDRIEFEQQFDGVWACASLIHVLHDAMPEAVGQLLRSLKDGGVMYMSFKYGQGEQVRDGRLFNYYEEESFKMLLRAYPQLRLVKLWRTADFRSDHTDTEWLNVLLRN